MSCGRETESLKRVLWGSWTKWHILRGSNISFQGKTTTKRVRVCVPLLLWSQQKPKPGRSLRVTEGRQGSLGDGSHRSASIFICEWRTGPIWTFLKGLGGGDERREQESVIMTSIWCSIVKSKIDFVFLCKKKRPFTFSNRIAWWDWCGCQQWAKQNDMKANVKLSFWNLGVTHHPSGLRSRPPNLSDTPCWFLYEIG